MGRTPSGTEPASGSATAGLPPVSHVVRRRRLFAALAKSTECRVTIVSGPAGSGKTLLVASWLHDAPWPGAVAWVSLERDEGDPARLWNVVLRALRSAGALPRRSRLERLIAAPGGWQDELVSRLAERLAPLPTPALLVLDDVHHLRTPALSALSALFARSPRQLHLVLIARHEPRVAFHRLRVSGELAEIRGADLRFSTPEARELLADAGVSLSDVALSRLHERTEGWAAGLRLAAIALDNGHDPDRLVTGFSGRQREIAQYLVTEVLAHQTPEVRHLLRSTCVLERVTGPLASLLAGRADAERVLQDLEEANAFVLSVDAGRSWFRYHNLLSDVLRMELRSEAPAEVDSLHR